MSSYRREARQRTIDANARLNQVERDGVAASVAAMGLTVVQPGTAIEEVRIVDNGLYLAAGLHSGATLTKDGTEIQAAPGARVEKQWKISTTGVIRITGVRFTSVDQQALITISATSTVVFTNCVFNKAEPSATTSFVSIEAGGKVSFVGCWFSPSKATAGFVVDNAGAAPNVYLVGGVNTTGQPHNNVVVLSEI
jgi:hypothetical protein